MNHRAVCVCVCENWPNRRREREEKNKIITIITITIIITILQMLYCMWNFLRFHECWCLARLCYLSLKFVSVSSVDYFSFLLFWFILLSFRLHIVVFLFLHSFIPSIWNFISFVCWLFVDSFSRVVSFVFICFSGFW